MIGLTSVTQCAGDLYYALTKIASNIKLAAKIEKMIIYIDHKRTIELSEASNCRDDAFDNFTNLKVVELRIKRVKDSSKPYDLPMFILELISKLPNIEKFKVIGNVRKLRNINKVIDIAPNNIELDISRIRMMDLQAEMWKVVRSIRKRRELQIAAGYQNPTPFHIVLTEGQWLRLQIFKDVRRILTAQVVKESCRLFDLTHQYIYDLYQ